MIWLSSAGRSLLRNKLRTIFTILSLIIGSASFFSMFLLSELAPRSIENSAKLLLGGDVLVQSYLKPLQSNIVNDIFQDMGEIDSHSSSYVGQSMVQSKNKTTSVILKGIDTKTYPYYGENQYPGIRSLQANEVLLADNAADRLQVKVGEKIWLPSASDGSLHEYKVKGLVLNVQESYGDADIFGAAYLPLNEAANLLNAPAGSTNEILIHWKAGTPKTSWQAELEKHLPSATLTDTKERTDESLAQAKTLLLLLQLFSLLALGISALTVSNTMKQAMSTRMRDIAVMKAIGVRSRSVLRYLFNRRYSYRDDRNYYWNSNRSSSEYLVNFLRRQNVSYTVVLGVFMESHNCYLRSRNANGTDINMDSSKRNSHRLSYAAIA